MDISVQARCHIDAYLRGDLSEKFYDIFRPREESPSKKKNDKKKGKKKTKLKDKIRKQKRDKSPEAKDSKGTVLEIHGNASAYNVYARVRQAVLDQFMREASRVYQLASGGFHSDSDSEDEGEDKSKEGVIKIPKVVGLGLNGVFELIRETETRYPELCIKALGALLDLLQGQQPEAMKSEPFDVIEKLYELLLDLSTSAVPEENREGQELTALACSGLLSLVVALGDTGKILNAIQSLLRGPPSLKTQEIKVPGIVTHLQRSIQAVLIGRSQLPEWFNQGVREKARCEKFPVDITVEDDVSGESSAVASDGKYLYIMVKNALYKIGTGYGSTIKGHMYGQKEMTGNKKVWLAFAGGKLFSKSENNSTVNLCVINRETMEVEETLVLDGNHATGPSILFSDGDSIGQIAPAKDQDNFVVRTYSPTESPLPLQHEVPLKLTRKCMDVVGTSAIDGVAGRHSVTTGFDEDAATIFAGKEFGLIRTVGGKVLYTGKPSALGIKQGGPAPNKWAELPITKSPKILQVAVGHEGQHALLVAEDGSVFFVGMSRRGEDGDASTSKARRQPKSVKPKKMIRLEAKHVVYAAANVGSSALVTREGEVYIFGKDNTYCDHSTGQVADLKDVAVTQVALGKAHAVALTAKGRIYTFGINNKGQCGRDFNPVSGREASNNVTMVEEEEEVEADDIICPPGKHRWKQYQCMVCIACGECTGYGSSCINSSRENRNVGEPCGCGAGDSGCSECGICRVCAGEKLEVDELDDRGLLGVVGGKKEVIPLDVLLSGRQGRQEYLARRLEQKLEKGELKMKQKLAKEKRNRAAAEGTHELDTDYTKSVTLAPAEVIVGNGNIPVTQVACGLHHTVVLLQNGDVYTFGSNSYGQLGLGDTNARGMPTKVPLPLAAVHVAAGNHHSVILLTSGQVYTCGDYQKGALGRDGPEEMVVKSKKAPWCSTPGPVPGVGARLGRRATWVGANGDQTFMRIDESLINAHTLARSNIFASQSCIGLIPKGGDSAAIMKCLMISKHDGNCKSFRDGDQEDLRDYSVCLDPVYDVLWGFSLKNGEVRCYNVLRAESEAFPCPDRGYCHVLSPELAVPAKPSCLVSRSHCALHILGCLDTLTMAQQLNLSVAEEMQERAVSTKVYTKEDYSIVNRFEGNGGGWGYSGHSVEAVRFTCDTDILLGGFGLFGGRGEYFGRIKLYELGVEGGENETDGELLAETEELAFECAPREKFAMLFEEPVHIQANCWYVALARISGPSSDCGSGGQSVVTTDDQVMFKFKSSKKSNNGTDVNAGQIPQLLYRLPSRDSHCVIRRNDHTEPAHILSPDFALSVTPHCFEALLQLLEWAWNSFHSSISDMDGLKGVHREAATADLRRLVYICCSCLRLMKTYVSQVYPDGVSKKKGPTENSEMVQCIGDMRELLKRILAEEVTPSTFRVFLADPASSHEFADLREEVLQECHEAYCACFHAFYPTTTLKWWVLCELLSQIEPGAPNVTGIGRLLAAVMQALCHPTVWLTNILPINLEPETVEVLRRHSFCMDDNTNSAARLGEYHRYPLLASHMSYRMEIDSMGSSHISFREVLDRLLMIVALPVRQALNDDPAIFPEALVSNTCALLTTIISELGSSATGLEMDVNTTSRPLLVTPNRFYRTSQSAYWNTGNGSPDAVCFSVDRPGIVIAGICMYGGGGTYEYEVELLDEAQTDVQGELSHTQRFNTLETVKGVFTFEDCVNDIMEIKFEHPIPIKEGVRYAVKLRNQGPRTLNGDGGMSKVKCPDGTTFTFSACPLSSNGTNHMRGQIPQILYYSSPQEGESQHHSIRNLAELQARKNALDIASAIVRMATELLHRAQSLDIEEVGEILGQSSLFASLLPLSLAYIGPVAAQDPRGAVQVLYLIQEILPAVVSLTKQMVPSSNLHGSVGSDATSTTATTATTIADSCTTSPHYAMVESEHPYKQATVSRYKVEFPSTVQWMALDFDPQCATAQVEDSLQLYIPSRHSPSPKGKSPPEDSLRLSHWPILKRFHGYNFPKQALILPGHEVVFSLETASDYLRDEKQSFYGFKCTVIGYEWSFRPEETVIHLEKELAYLGGLCSASLMKRDISLPQVTMEELDDEMDLIEEHAQLSSPLWMQVYHAHASLLGKGFALSHPPSIIQALEGNLPFCWQSNERAFLKDYVLCTPGTSGGRLARWLQPDSYLDPKQCEVICNTEDLKCSWPAVITIVTRDQYGDMVNVPDLKVEVNAVPVDQKDNVGEDYKRLRRMSRPDEGDLNFGGHPVPNLDTPYEPTMRDRKDVYHSISMMKAYENYSFEELRFAAPAVPRPSENMLVRTNNDGTYSANWTPSGVGCYSIHVSVDGYQAGELSKVEVREPPQGMPPPAQVIKKHHQPSRRRRFVQSNSAGLRIRVHPTLQSEQIGVIKPSGIISFVDEVHNDDGVWLRLSAESAKEWGCDGYNEAWCLQYNQHLGKMLLVPVEEPKSMEEMGKEAGGLRKSQARRAQKKQCKGPGVYQVVKCGAYGHNIRARPNLKGTPIGMLTKGAKVTVLEDSVNSEGTWVRLDPESSEQLLQSSSGDAWSLAVGHDGIEYLQHESEFGLGDKDPFSFNSLPPASQRGFNFAASSTQYGATFPGFKAKEGFTRAKSLPYTGFAFGLPLGGTASVPSFGQNYGEASGSQFGGAAFGSASDVSDDRDTNQSQSQEESSFSTPTVAPPRPPPPSEVAGKSGGGETVAHTRPDLPPELQGASVKELVRALGESRANANGPTPNPSPPGSPKTRSPKRTSRSTSPLPGAEAGSPEVGRRGSFSKEETFRTPPASPLPSRSSRGRLKKEPSFERSASTPPTTPPPIRKEYLRGMSEGAGLPPSAPGSASSGTPRYGSPGRGASPMGRGSCSSPQFGAGASGSREGSPSSQMAGAFNIGSSSPKEEAARLSPKAMRKDRGRQLRSKRDRASSPASRDVPPVMRGRSSSASIILDRPRQPVKEALSPSVAECLRAVFAAFMWHEGIVHDAMACASFLKFHPDLTKEMSKFVKSKKQEKTRVRHATDSSKDRRDRKKDNINESRVRFNLEPQTSDVTDYRGRPPSPMPHRPPIERQQSDGGGGGSERSPDWKDFDPFRGAGESGGAGEDKEPELPPTLQHLVYFWEELTSSIIKIIKQDLMLPSIVVIPRAKKGEKKEKEKEKEKARKKRPKEAQRGAAAGAGAGRQQLEAAVGMMMLAAERGAGAGAAGAGAAGGASVSLRIDKDGKETLCELCGLLVPHPVTYHMRECHPGCGRHACGKGFNSAGNFCGGWAGNCGEGGIGGSTWYLMCSPCRERYMKEKRQSQREKEKAKRKLLKKAGLSKQSSTTTVAQQDTHMVLKNNAMFLLDLASASGFVLPKHSHKKAPFLRSDIILPSVSENFGTELEPFPSVPFQYLLQQNAAYADSAFADDFFIDDDERVFVRSGSLSITQSQRRPYRPRLPTEPRHSPLARSGSLGQEIRPFSHISLPSPQEKGEKDLADHKPIIKSAGTSPDGEQEGGKKLFHRSISEYVSDDENGQFERLGNRGLYARRRNNSGGVSDGGMSLLKHPSAAMTKLIGSVDRSVGGMGEHRALQRPVLEFIIQRHDLEGLQLAMKQALRKAACRVFAMQAFNWLLRSVVQQTCLHDLLWFFVKSLMPLPEPEEEEEEQQQQQQQQQQAPKEHHHPKKEQLEMDVPLCEHPLADIEIAGKAVAPLPETFHGVLQTISDAIMHLPSGSALQRMAMSCYCLRFQQTDHQFLHESHVFSNISRILSKSEEEQEECSIDASQIAFRVSTLKDLTPTAELKASSRQAMIASLTDNSTETFWESGDEDRNKVKTLTITCPNTSPQVICVHIDNTRDLAAKVSNVTFSAGTSSDALTKVYQAEVELRQAGWVTCPLPTPQCSCLQLELKGPDQSLRVRQVKVLGLQAGEESFLPVKKTTADIQQDNCEAETLRVFRILTAQVFGHLIFAERVEEKVEAKKEVNPPVDRDHDLKEHMVGILFSRSKLSHLQKQVCSHIVLGIRKETARIKEEWENSLALSSSVHDDPPEDGRGVDAYCFELLSMVLALSGSAVGRNYLAQQHHLLQDLFSLLHTATPRIQRQVTSVLRRVLPEVRPQVLATILGVPALPPVDYSIATAESQQDGDASYDPERPCILDVFLGVISKALTLQMKVKSGGPSKGVVSITLAEALDAGSVKAKGSRWWLRGSMTSSLASTIISLVQDMAAGTLSETWASVTKAAIAEAILNLTKLDSRHRLPEVCIKTPTLWLAVAALCVLDKDHVERLSSGEWVNSPDGQHGQPRPTCDNHDDGVTPAIVLCNVCNNLCADCDRFLHLPRRTRSHQRQVFKEEEEAIKVDLHEGCGRTKLFWVMALADSKTLKAMVEFREGKVTGAVLVPGTCRFCGTHSTSGLLAIGNVCTDADCQSYAETACTKTLSCGHMCGGIRDEDPCLPCLHQCRPQDQEHLKQDADDMCMICFTEALSAAPAIQFTCGHVFHLHCAKMVLEKRWVGPRITFGFSLCPICKNPIEHRVLRGLLEPVRRLYEDVRRKALMRLEYEGLHKAEAITTPGARFYQDPAGFAMDRYAYYVCSKCNKAYYGGEARCEEQAGGGEDYDPTELVCGACSDVSRAQMCPKHGTDFLEYKCRYCCSVAVFFCFGTTHFCNACHDDFQRVTNIPKTDLPSCPAGPRGKQLDCDECPLHVQHPPTGEEFALGCGVCRNAHTF